MGGGDGGGGGTAMTSGGSSGSDATFTATYGGGGTPEQYDSSLRPKKKSQITDTAVQKEEPAGEKGYDSVDRSLEKNAEVYGTYEGISQLAAPDAASSDGPRKNRTESKHIPGDGVTTRASESVDYSEARYMEPHQRPIGDGQSSYVIADRKETYKPQNEENKHVKNPAHQRVAQRFFDEDEYTMRTTDPAAEQFTNLSMSMLSQVAQDVQSHFIRSTDTLESLGESDAFKVLNSNSLEKKLDLGQSLVVAGWGNYYVVDQEGHRISLGGMQRAIKRFLAHPEYANMNIFHSGIQVGQILEKFVDKDGRIWTTEVRPEGLFVVAAFRTDLEVSRKAMAEVMKGTMRGFSIAGNAKEKEIKCDHGKCWTEVTELDIYEVTLCVTPMNQKSYITDIVQKPDPDSCPDCYVGNHVEYDSDLKVRI